MTPLDLFRVMEAITFLIYDILTENGKIEKKSGEIH
jgi:hypothetical protein